MTVADPSSSTVQPGDVVAGKYRVERVLGAGGMGVVVAATHVKLGQKVALKLLLPQTLDRTEMVERFQREAQAAARLKSDHVARVIDVGVLDSGAPFMVMEHLEGLDLSQLVRARGPLPAAQVAELVLQACEAIGEAHAAEIVHRDLKPSNLFLTRTVSGAPRVKVLDFGISKLRTTEGLDGEMDATKSTAVMGSPIYMSPEQMRSSKNVDARADIWSLGVVLYELLSGRPPWDGSTVFEIAAAVLRATPPPLTESVADLDPALEQVVLRCMSKDPADRYASVAELVEALTAFRPSAAQISSWDLKSTLSLTDTMQLEESPTETLGPTPTPKELSAPSRSAVPATSAAESQAKPATNAPGASTTAAMVQGAALASGKSSSWMVVAAVAVVATGVGVVGMLTQDGVPPSIPATSAPTSTSVASTGAVSSPSVAAEPAPFLRHPCADPSTAEGVSGCPKDARAWCDEREQRIACCGNGLVPLGADGICGCPPGGVADNTAVPHCKQVERTGKQISAELVGLFRARLPDFKACFEKTLDIDASTSGQISFAIELTPEGHLFSLRIHDSSWPDPEGQACALKVVRTMKFRPPRGGTQTLVYPLQLAAR